MHVATVVRISRTPSELAQKTSRPVAGAILGVNLSLWIQTTSFAISVGRFLLLCTHVKVEGKVKSGRTSADDARRLRHHHRHTSSSSLPRQVVCDRTVLTSPKPYPFNIQFLSTTSTDLEQTRANDPIPPPPPATPNKPPRPSDQPNSSSYNPPSYRRVRTRDSIGEDANMISAILLVLIALFCMSPKAPV